MKRQNRRTAVRDKNPGQRGRLKIGDDWNAIRIIALSQSNPLKAVAEFVENAIDARAKIITITRGREHGAHYLSIKDDGNGVPRDGAGLPDFKYVATHICDSIKRRLKEQGDGAGLQGEFGIGLLSFWTVGETLTMTSTGADERAYQMTMKKGDPGFSVSPRRMLFGDRGTELHIGPLLEGIRTLSGEKIQWYLASELRDRIRQSAVRVTVIDKLARKQYDVEPRQYEGRLLHQLPAMRTSFGDVYAEIYLAEPADTNRVALTRAGTRVLEDLTTLPGLDHPPWTSRYLQGLLDVPFVNLTPGTRNGVILDERFSSLLDALAPLEANLNELIAAQQRAEEEQASRESLKAIQRAFREAMLALPREEYDWFEVPARKSAEGASSANSAEVVQTPTPSLELNGGETFGVPEPTASEGGQRQFFDFPGPLYSAMISPASATVSVGDFRTFKALPRDRSRRIVDADLIFDWALVGHDGVLEGSANQEVVYRAPAMPGLATLQVTVRQHGIVCQAEALVTVTQSLGASAGVAVVNVRGLPGYTFERAAGELWRSRFDAARNVIVVNNGHRDFVFATKNRALQLRYLVRLYVKELVMRNFAGLPPDQLLERMVELTLHTEERLKS